MKIELRKIMPEFMLPATALIEEDPTAELTPAQVAQWQKRWLRRGEIALAEKIGWGAYNQDRDNLSLGLDKRRSSHQTGSP